MGGVVQKLAPSALKLCGGRPNLLSFLWLAEKEGVHVGRGGTWRIEVCGQCYTGGGTLQTIALIVPINLPCLCSYASWLRVQGVAGAPVHVSGTRKREMERMYK